MTFPHGTNLVLGTLSLAFTELIAALNLTSEHATDYARLRVPDWVDATPLLSYPFRHTRPFLDLAEDARVRLLHDLRRVPAVMGTADVTGVRNRIDHWREEEESGRSFPSETEIKTVCDAVETLVNNLTESGLYPCGLRLVQQTGDAYERVRIEFAGSGGKSLTLFEPSSLMLTGLPRSHMQVALTGARIAEQSDCLRFRLVAPSAYSDMVSTVMRLRLPHPEDLAAGIS